MKGTAVQLIGPRLRDHIHYAAGGTSELSGSSGCDDLELFDRVECDVDSGSLSSDLFPEEPVVVIAAVQTDVVVDSALAGEVDLIAIRTLHDANSRCERQQVFKLSSQNGSLIDGYVV